MTLSGRLPAPGAILSRVEAVLLDMDGLLIDSEASSFRAWRQAAMERGFQISLDIFRKVVGHSVDESHRIFREILGDEFRPELMRDRKTEIQRSMMQRSGMALKPGARALLDYLSARRIPWAVATSTHAAATRERLEAAGIAGTVQYLVTGDMVEKVKPAPDIYLEAAAQLGVAPAVCLAFEDSENGARAALAAGASVVLVPDLVEPGPDVARQCLMTAGSLYQGIEYLSALDFAGSLRRRE